MMQLSYKTSKEQNGKEQVCFLFLFLLREKREERVDSSTGLHIIISEYQPRSGYEENNVKQKWLDKIAF